MPSEHWQNEPQSHDFPAAEHYLSLICEPALSARLARRLRGAPTTIYEAKDLLRAARLPLLERENAHVAGDLEKVRAGEKLSPVLLVRGRFKRDAPLVIADGYHRVCASYWIDENAAIPCRIVDLVTS